MRAELTAPVIHSLGPWIDEQYKYSICQIYNNHNSLSSLELINMLSLHNIGHYAFHYNPPYFLPKYYPSIILGIPKSIAQGWIDDSKYKTPISSWPESLAKNLQLSYYYTQIPSYGDIDIRAEHTTGGRSALSPWNNSTYSHSALQLYLGYNPLSKIEVVSLLNIYNLPNEFTTHSASRTAKYNPQIYLGYINTTSHFWNKDPLSKKEIPWPESYQL